MAVPTILIGTSAELGKNLVKHLAPEYEITHYLDGAASAKSDISLVLAGKEPSNKNDVGTGKLVAPRVVLVGRTISAGEIEAIKQAAGGAAKEPVAWVIADPSKASQGPPPDFAVAAAGLKKALSGWGGAKDEDILY
ncbi:hypothetical protein F4778DRAFT_783005 [Xylariomycetidae sp. FL2044]|nr:hypothetical protein F4778DRAFT_783005 [Xylariomycetidae sp. FL2044]